jgi:hypothetical protein
MQMWYFKDLIIMAWQHNEITIEGKDGEIPAVSFDDLPVFIQLLQDVLKALQKVNEKSNSQKEMKK